MQAYTFVVSKNPFEQAGTPDILLFKELSKNSELNLFLVQNGVFCLRQAQELKNLNAKIYADDFSLAERGMLDETQAAGAESTSIDTLTDLIIQDQMQTVWL